MREFRRFADHPAEPTRRAIKEVTSKRHDEDSHDQLQHYLELVVNADNYALRLKTLNGLTPAQFIRKEKNSISRTATSSQSRAAMAAASRLRLMAVALR